MRRLALAGLILASTARAASMPVPVGGLWLTPGGRALVRIAPCGAALCGHVAKVLKPPAGGPAVDGNNHDPALRSRPIEGLALLTGYHAESDHWAGRVYDPDSGRSYRSEMTRRGEILDVKGCLSFFCRTQHWTAYRDKRG